MRLLSFDRAGEERFGVVVDADAVVDLTESIPGVANIADLLAQDRLGEVQPLVDQLDPGDKVEQLNLLPVIPNPSKVICVGLNYVAHAEEAGRKVGEHPVIFQRYAGSLTGHGQALIRPLVSNELDYEGELAVILGKPGSNIAKDDAMDHVAGYTCFNDASIRDWQFHTHQYGMGKNFQRTGALGPWLVTSDEIPDYRDLEVRTNLNGNQMQQGKLDQLAFDIPALISYVSHALPWNPGDILATGTPSGIGFKRHPPVFLKPGDQIEVAIDRIGTLANTVEDEPRSEYQ